MNSGKQGSRAVDFAGVVPVDEPWTTVSRSRRRNETTEPARKAPPRDQLRASTSSMLANATNTLANGTLAPGARLQIFYHQETSSGSRTSSTTAEKIADLSAAKFMQISRRFEFFVRNNGQFKVYKLDLSPNVIPKAILNHIISVVNSISTTDLDANKNAIQVSWPATWTIQQKLKLYRFTQWLWLQGGLDNTDLYDEMEKYVEDTGLTIEPSAVLAIWRESRKTEDLLRTRLVERCVSQIRDVTWAAGTENEHMNWLSAFACNKTLCSAYKDEYDKSIDQEIEFLKAEEAQRRELEELERAET